ncbi:MAG: hypothetical protein H8E94_00035 [Alphaproteobacteria bacterium]|nr:hypothetical protein [Alphaproteobacteria bacterium]
MRIPTKTIIGAISIAVLTGCATQPEKLEAAYISPTQYESYSCKQLSAELTRVDRRKDELHASLRKLAGNDQAQMAVGMILFWPALFFLEGGDGSEATEYSRLKGESETIEKVLIRKNCAHGA